MATAARLNCGTGSKQCNRTLLHRFDNPDFQNECPCQWLTRSKKACEPFVKEVRHADG